MSDGASSVQQRKFAYAALCVVLLASTVPLGRFPATADPWIHTVLDTVSTVLACTVGAISLVRYFARNSLSYLLLGTGFLGAGVLNGFHAVITAPPCVHCTPQAIPNLAACSGVISGTFLALVLCGRLFAPRTERSLTGRPGISERTVGLLAGAGILATCVAWLFVPLPAVFPLSPIHQPAALASGFVFTAVALGYFSKGAWKTSRFEHCLLLFLITAAIQHSVYLPFSGPLFDAPSWAAHTLAILSYLFVLVGLLYSTLSVFRSTAEALADQKRLNESLAVEITQRQRAEQQLQQARRELESRVAASTAELAQQDQLASLSSEIALVLTQTVLTQMALTQYGSAHETFHETLQRSAEIMV